MTPRLYLLLGLAILAHSFVGHATGDSNFGVMISYIPILAGFMAIGHAIQRVCHAPDRTP